MRPAAPLERAFSLPQEQLILETTIQRLLQVESITTGLLSDRLYFAVILDALKHAQHLLDHLCCLRSGDVCEWVNGMPPTVLRNALTVDVLTNWLMALSQSLKQVEGLSAASTSNVEAIQIGLYGDNDILTPHTGTEETNKAHIEDDVDMEDDSTVCTSVTNTLSADFEIFIDSLQNNPTCYRKAVEELQSVVLRNYFSRSIAPMFLFQRQQESCPSASTVNKVIVPDQKTLSSPTAALNVTLRHHLQDLHREFREYLFMQTQNQTMNNNNEDGDGGGQNDDAIPTSTMVKGDIFRIPPLLHRTYVIFRQNSTEEKVTPRRKVNATGSSGDLTKTTAADLASTTVSKVIQEQEQRQGRGQGQSVEHEAYTHATTVNIIQQEPKAAVHLGTLTILLLILLT
jgi:hypothetical protein